MSIPSRNPSRHYLNGLFTVRRLVLLTLLVLIAGFALILGVKTWSVKSNLEMARDGAQKVKDALLKGSPEEAAGRAQEALNHAESARSAARSIPWRMAAGVPFLGTPFKTGQQISDVVVDLAANILRPAASAGVGLSTRTLYADGRVDLQLLRKQEPVLADLSESAALLDAKAAAIEKPAISSPISGARTQLQSEVTGMARLFRNTAIASRVAPSMMGADGPRSYLLAFQTNAEARGTGGLLGGIGVLRFDNGKPSVDNIAANYPLTGAKASVDLGPEFDKQYGFTNPFTDFRNSNISSHFPYAAQIWKSMFEQVTGSKVDGVIAMDPVALSYILAATGSVTLPDGEVISKDNVVELTESTAYVRFADNNLARKQYLQDIASAVVGKMTGKVESPGGVLDALGKAAAARRIAVWSAIPADQKILEETTLAYAIPDDRAPYAEVVINNLGGSKMDYYLRRKISYAADSCNGDTRGSTVTIGLTNSLNDTKNLPQYVIGSEGLISGLPLKVIPGSMVTSVRLLATQGSRLVGVTSNGERLSAVVHQERGRPSYEVQVVIPPGQSGELSFQLSEPTAKGKPRVPIQPLIDEITPVVSVPECS